MRTPVLRTIVALVGTLASEAAAAEDRVWQTLPVPGGVAGLAGAADLDPAIESWRVLYETSRRLHATYGDPARTATRREAVGARLRAYAPRFARGPERSRGVPDAPGRADDSTGPADRSVLLPLPSQLWRKAVLGKEATDDRLLEALLEDREASLLYRGLAQLDEPTLQFFARQPDLVKWVHRKRADVFSVFAGSFRVRDERVLVPGGREAEPLWEDVAGESPSRPERFVKKLLAGGDGRLAFFYDATWHLEPAALRFALGLHEADARRRLERFRALAGVFGQGPAWWRPEGGAFARPHVDPAVVLRLVKVDGQGRPLPPAGRAFWEAVFAGDVPSATGLDLPGPDPVIDAAFLAEAVGLAPSAEERRARLTQLTFAQRVLGDVSPEARADALVTLRGLARQPALVLALDRMDVRAPAVYAQAVRRAEALPSAGSSRRAASTLTQFQGTLALVERARFMRAIEAADAEALVASLAAVATAGGGYDGGIARWIAERLRPALAKAVDDDTGSASAEQLVLRAMAGDRVAARDAPTFEWEGLFYRALPGVGEKRRLSAVRERQGGNTLDAVLAFAGAARRFAESGLSDHLGEVREATRTLDTSVLSREASDLVAAIDKVSSRSTKALVLAADDLLADTLASLAYAPHLGSAQGTALLGANVARRHDLSGDAWGLPEEVIRPGVPWHVRGSLLALDVALARLSLRRLTGDMPLRPPGLDPPTALGFARAVALRSPVMLKDEDAGAIAAAIARGRERVARVADAREAYGFAREAGLDAWRTERLRFTLLDEPRAAAGFFTLHELLRLGRLDPVPGEAWGTPDLAQGGSLRLRFPRTSGTEDLLGQRPEPHLAEVVPDPVWRVATELHARHLPASLTPGVLGLFTQDLVQEADPTSPDDGLAIARLARDWPADRFDDYVSALTGDGPLVPAPDPGDSPSPR